MFASALAKILPYQLWIYGAVAAVLVSVIGGMYIDLQHQETLVAKGDAKYATAVATAASAALVDTAHQRQIETLQSDLQKAYANDHLQEIASAQADAASAVAARDSLYARYVATLAAIRRAGSRSAAAPVGPGQPASSPDDLLADMQRRLGEAEDQLATTADARLGTGLECERDYGALGVARKQQK